MRSETVPVVVRVRGVGPRFVEEMIEALSCKVTIISPPLSVTEGVTLVKSPQMRDWGLGLCLLSKYRRIAVWGDWYRIVGITALAIFRTSEVSLFS
jgi:hypothetical protein